ncbi:helix-turn-helix domain-containing protein [Weissella bombi]|uniref:Transcriptional regulator, contains XRE-family HTH domain n=1 Tax=Weissella bombi TaxID=1505725 RepID=A0A1C4C4R9_9LACO|nr:helix-turn-helix transcriptional regulator [Weissella bombi]SCC14090.1 Transcriptional regulator, contains XRE-family HTH domain [Weissella bombi]
MTIFERTKEAAKTRGMSLQETATAAGIGINSIYGWKNKKPSIDRIKAVADVLGVSIDYLLGNTDEMHPTKKDGVLDLREVSDDERYELVSAGGRPITDEDWAIIKAVLAKYPRKED